MPDKDKQGTTPASGLVKVTNPNILAMLEGSAETEPAATSETTPPSGLVKVTDPSTISMLNGEVKKKDVSTSGASSATPSTSGGNDYSREIYNAAKAEGASEELANILVAQAKHESDNFTSNVFKKSGNPFGMTYAGQSGATHSSTAQPRSEGGTEYAGFDNLTGATKNVIDWLRRREKEGKLKVEELKDTETYAKEIRKSGYYTAPESLYAKALKRLYTPMGSETAPTQEGGATATSIQGGTQNQPAPAPVAAPVGQPTDSDPLKQFIGYNEMTYVPPATPHTTVNSMIKGMVQAGKKGAAKGSDVLKKTVLDVRDDVAINSTRKQTDGATALLANDILNTAGDNPKLIDEVANPNGNPQALSGYLRSRIQQLEKQKADEINAAGYNDPLKSAGLSPNGLNQINDKYQKQIDELTNSAGHMLALQLGAREYSSNNVVNFELKQQQLGNIEAQRQEALRKVDEQHKEQSILDFDITPAKKRQEYAQINQQFDERAKGIKGNDKYDPTRLGLDYATLMGLPNAERDLQDYQSGKLLNPASKVKYDGYGLEAMQTAARNAAASGKVQEAENIDKHSSDVPKRLEDLNKSYFVQERANAIGNERYKDESVLFSIIPQNAPTKEELLTYGKKAGLTDKQIEEINPNQVPVSATLPQQAIASLYNSAAPLYEQGVRLLGKAAGVPQEALNQRFYAGWENNPEYSMGAAVLGNIPSEQNSFKNVRGALGHIVGGATALVGLGGEIGGLEAGLKAVGAGAKTASKLANFGVMSMNGYNNAYHESEDIIGDDPKDETKRQVFAMATGVVEGLIFSRHPPSKLITNALGKLEKPGKVLLDEMGKKGILEAVTDKSLMAKYVMEISKDLGTQITLAEANLIASEGIKMIAEPNTQKGEGLGDKIIETAATTTLAMLLPSIGSGAAKARSATPLNQAALFEIGSNPEPYVKQITDMRNSGEISNDEAMRMFEGMKTANEAVRVTPTQNAEGDPLSPDQMKAYTYSLFQENMVQRKLDDLVKQQESSTLPPDKALTKPLEKKISELQAQRSEILASAGQPPVPQNGVPPVPPDGTEPIAEATPEGEGKPEGESKPADAEPVEATETEVEKLNREWDDELKTAETDEQAAEINAKFEAKLEELKPKEQEATTEEPATETNAISVSEKETRIADLEKRWDKELNEAPGTEEAVAEINARYEKEMEELQNIPTFESVNVNELKTNQDGKSNEETSQRPNDRTQAGDTEGRPEIRQETDRSGRGEYQEGRVLEDQPTVKSEGEADKTTSPLPVEETAKTEKDAIVQSREQQQEGTEQSSEQEYARTEQTGGEEATASTEGGDSNIGGEKGKEKVSETPPPPPKPPKQPTGESEGEGKRKNKVEETPLTDSGLSEYLGLKNTKKNLGEEATQDDLTEAKTRVDLADLQADAKTITQSYREGGGDSSKWGREMLNDIKAVKNDGKKQGVAAAGLHIELQSDRLRNDARMVELDAAIMSEKDPAIKAELQKERASLYQEQAKVKNLIGEVQNFAKKLKSAASDVMNTGRLDKLMYDDVLTELYEKQILNKAEIKAREEAKAAIEADEPTVTLKRDKKSREPKKKTEKTEQQKKEEAAKKDKAAEMRAEKEEKAKVTKEMKEKAVKEKAAAEADFPRKADGSPMTPKEFVEYLKEKKKPC